MKCKKCNQNNIVSASYCQNCGNPFTPEEKKQARSKTFVGRLEKIENVYKICTLKTVTDNLLFKIGSIFIILLVGIGVWIQNGSHIKILEDKNYQIQYNTKNKEYYLLVEKEQTNLKLYIPNSLKKLKVNHYNQEDELTETKEYKVKDSIVLKSSSSNEYYIISSNQDKKKKEGLKIYVFKKEETKKSGNVE